MTPWPVPTALEGQGGRTLSAAPALTPRLCLQIEVGTLAPRPKDPAALPDLGATAETPKLPPLTTAGPVHPAPVPAQGECGPLGAPQWWGLVPMGCSHASQGWQDRCSGGKGANPFATSRQQQLFARPGVLLGVRLIAQQAGGLQRDISGKQELQQSSNILMSRGIATVGQSSN